MRGENPLFPVISAPPKPPGASTSAGKQLADIVNGHAGISPEMAIRLDKAFGGGAETCYRLQAADDLAQALKRADRIKVGRLSPAA